MWSYCSASLELLLCVFVGVGFVRFNDSSARFSAPKQRLLESQALAGDADFYSLPCYQFANSSASATVVGVYMHIGGFLRVPSLIFNF